MQAEIENGLPTGGYQSKRRADQTEEDTPESLDPGKSDPKDKADGDSKSDEKAEDVVQGSDSEVGPSLRVHMGRSEKTEAYGKAEYRVELHDEPTEIPPGHGWAETVITRLKYRSVTRTLTSRPNGVMVDDQRVLTIVTTGTRPAVSQEVRQEVTTLCM